MFRRITNMSSALPKVTVIIPCFNQGRYLSESIRSARLAYQGPLEIIVVDDGSNEPQAERWLREAQAIGDHIHIVRQSNRGLSGARNEGLRIATGKFVQFLDSDDILVPGKIDIQIAHFTVARDIDVSVSNFLLCDDERNFFTKPDEAIARFGLTLEDFLFHWERGFVIPIHCAIFRRELLQSMLFDEDAKAKEDWLFWCSLLSKGARLRYVPNHLAIYRQHDQSMRRSYVSMGKNWLKAAIKIDSFVCQTHPLFFDSAVNWFQQCYQKNALYQEEIRSLSTTQLRIGPIEECNQDRLDLSEKDAINKVVHYLTPLSGQRKNPLISVVIPLYNHFEHFIECLVSLGQQREQSFEVLIIDDASSDTRIGPLLTILSEKFKGIRIVRHTKNCGISFTQNEAVTLARGDFIAFLDCDDGLEEHALETVRRNIEANPEIDYLFSDRYDIDTHGTILRHAKYGGYQNITPQPHKSIKEDLLDGMVASHLKVIRRSCYLMVGGTSDQYSGCQDWELALKIAEMGRFLYMPDTLYRHRIHTKSVTSSDRVSQFRKTNLLRRIYGEKWYREKSTTIASDEENTRLFSANIKLPSLEELKNVYFDGKKCVFDFRGYFDIQCINFLREFNSYFDHILWDDPAVPAALVGYLWNDALLCRQVEPA
jgi:O-antigen biosynthesis protein